MEESLQRYYDNRVKGRWHPSGGVPTQTVTEELVEDILKVVIPKESGQIPVPIIPQPMMPDSFWNSLMGGHEAAGPEVSDEA